MMLVWPVVLPTTKITSSRNLAPLRTAVLVEGILHRLFEIGVEHESDPLHFAREIVERCFYAGARRDAGSINRGFLDWLARRPEKTRPFFVFLNYLDAHAPYKLPEGAQHRFGHKPQPHDEIRVVYEGWDLIDKSKLPRHYLNMARDAYDDCVAYIDDQLGVLFEELERRASTRRYPGCDLIRSR